MNKAENNNKEVEENKEIPLEESEVSETENPIISIEKERDEWKDKFVRLYSEYENFRKRTAKEKNRYFKNYDSKCNERSFICLG